MDAIALLKKDHRTVEALFKRFVKAGDGAQKMKRKLVDEIIVELSRHTAIEEQYFYPACRSAFGKAKQEIVMEALEEHHVAKWTLQELLYLSPDNERFDAKVTVLMEGVRQHIKEEEGKLFPMVREAMESAELKKLGARLEAAKKTVPTRPHPRGPDAPPANQFLAPVERVLDRGRDMLKSLTARQAMKSRANGRSPDRTTH